MSSPGTAAWKDWNYEHLGLSIQLTMSLVFSERALLPERMDTEPLDDATTGRILKALEQVNAWLGGVQATLTALKAYSQRWKPGELIRFIDWGTGSADIPRAIVRWCRTRGYRAKVVGIDMNAAIINYARHACRDYPEITLVQQNFSDVIPAQAGIQNWTPAFAGVTAEKFDYAITSLCLHHLNNHDIVALLKKSDRLVRRGIIMNDLKRSARAWAWIWSLTRLLGAHPIVQNDGPLSVQNAFTKKELEALAQSAGLPYLRVRTHFGYRFTLAGEKK